MKRIAMMYDFDKTLCDRDMQEYSFMKAVNTSPAEFWSDTTKVAISENMDKIITYLYKMVEYMKKNNIKATKEFLTSMGKDVVLFPGVKDFFQRIKTYALKYDIEVEHYIISSGLKEIIEGTEIAKEFKDIFACEFFYENDEAIWPKSVVNYTTKTQFLFRISKGALEISDDKTVNNLIKEEDRYITFGNMIYLGDGLTDVPCMQLVKSNGGHSIAIYQNIENAMALKEDNRVDFLCEADYQLDSKLDNVIKKIIDLIAKKNELSNLK